MPEEIQDDITPESSPEEVTEVEETPVEPAPQAEKMVPYSRFKEVNDKLAQLRAQPAPQASTQLDVSDLIAINASLEGLAPREKEKLAELHKLTRTPLAELRNSEDFLFWQQGYQSQVEKERALKPSGSQPELAKPVKLSELLTDPKVTREEKEKLLKDNGLYKEYGNTAIQRRVLMP